MGGRKKLPGLSCEPLASSDDETKPQAAGPQDALTVGVARRSGARPVHAPEGLADDLAVGLNHGAGFAAGALVRHGEPGVRLGSPRSRARTVRTALIHLRCGRRKALGLRYRKGTWGIC